MSNPTKPPTTNQPHQLSPNGAKDGIGLVPSAVTRSIRFGQTVSTVVHAVKILPRYDGNGNGLNKLSRGGTKRACFSSTQK